MQVVKTEETLRRLDDFLSGGTRALSASTINTYLDCPLKFYFSSVEKLKEEEDVAESVDNRVFGNILHQVNPNLGHIRFQKYKEIMPQ